MTNTPTLAARVEERRVGPFRLFVLKTPAHDIVSWQGGFLSAPDFAAGEEVIQEMVVRMLDKGTRYRDRFAIADVIENRGAHLSFSSNERYVKMYGRALRNDVPDVLRAMAEQLREPLFDAGEYQKTQAHLASALYQSLENTGAQASGALTRRIYSDGHPNYTPPTTLVLTQLEALSVEEVRAYHEAHFGSNAGILVFVGDVEMDSLEEVVRETLGDWKAHEARGAFATAAPLQAPGEENIPIAGKMNTDVRIGHALAVRRDDGDYLPLYLANFMLGGNFSSRLMTTVRDERGLTYGIRSALSGISTEYDGHWQINVTLSQEHIAQGIAATTEVIKRFVAEGPTDNELADSKTTIAGSFKVGLATTRGLASSLYTNARRGFAVGYLDQFPKDVAEISLSQVLSAMQQHFRPDAFQLARAGMVPVAEVR